MIKNGWSPRDVFGNDLPWQGEMPDVWVEAFSIIFSELESGSQFNWHTMRFEEPKR